MKFWLEFLVFVFTVVVALANDEESGGMLLRRNQFVQAGNCQAYSGDISRNGSYFRLMGCQDVPVPLWKSICANKLVTIPSDLSKPFPDCCEHKECNL